MAFVSLHGVNVQCNVPASCQLEAAINVWYLVRLGAKLCILPLLTVLPRPCRMAVCLAAGACLHPVFLWTAGWTCSPKGQPVHASFALWLRALPCECAKQPGNPSTPLPATALAGLRSRLPACHSV